MPPSQPAPAYHKPPIDTALYESIASNPSRTLTHSHTIPPRSGYSWTVPAGSILRLSTPEGPQVGDLNIWNLHNPRERLWAARTRQLQSSHVTKGDRLWSCLPFLRPMVTIISDSLGGYGVDEFGGRCHDLLGTRCDPYVNKLLTGDSYDFHCHSNLTRAILPHGLTEYDVHDVLNVFQVTGLNAEGRYFMEASPAKKGDYIEFFAEQDLLCALSTCPGGDLSNWGWAEGEGGNMLDCCRPIMVEVFEVADKEVLKGWEEPKRPDYKGAHGMVVPSGEAKKE
ncbi:hypothetical protein BLS_003851 [Venturia inaequalis]|uniref:DUF1989 domain-containing protein n=1 Tax=Venturia inaequalis TaxID=5025 RepID=A0A8H3UJA2_VENIN|nr:hypothetical protein EG328_005758 [Venturia inaequalis]KAE9983704.1 hypothetical protein BLS_003851 [Venturia inaequalis]KAE9992273.1 hypothetical protein EG327_009534 [Venturia inaequalis]RDI83180.1 hypothetical protein Vi05172_g6904 [Venturia inaequalis]